MLTLTWTDIKERPLQLAISALLVFVPLGAVFFRFSQGDWIGGVLSACIFLLAYELTRRDWKKHAPPRMEFVEPNIEGILDEISDNLERFDLSPSQIEFLSCHASSVAAKMADQIDVLQETYGEAIGTLSNTNQNLGVQLETARNCLNRLLTLDPGGPVQWQYGEPYGETLRLGILRAMRYTRMRSDLQAAEEARRRGYSELADIFEARAQGCIAPRDLVQRPEA